MKQNEYLIPYSDRTIPVLLPEERVIFDAGLPELPRMEHWTEMLRKRLDAPTAGAPLSDILAPDKRIVILVEDNTRHTPVREMLPVLCEYLADHGCSLSQVQILIAPGTHRVLTDEELHEKLGSFAMENLTVSQHDYRDAGALVKLESVSVAGMEIPVEVNRIAVEADVLIGLGNIIPHPNAGYSGGAKILDPGCCGKRTVSATHVSAALMGYLPLGKMENSCRDGLELVARRAGLSFIVNVVLDAENRVVDLVTGDPVRAHRVGARSAQRAFGVLLPQQADVLISCSYPYDIDYWQCEKALISGYFAVKEGGIIILAAPCREGLAHNHDDLLSWLAMSRTEAEERLRRLWESGEEGDLVAASIAIGAVTVRERARVFIYSDGLSADEIDAMGYRGFDSLQSAVDAALAEYPNGTIGILSRGGDCLPLLSAQEETTLC